MKLPNLDVARASVVQVLLKDCQEKLAKAISLMAEGVYQPHKITVEEIQDIVSIRSGMSRERLLGKGRSPKVVRARQLAMYVARQCTTLSYVELAESFRRTHASVISGIEHHQNLMDTELSILKDTNEVLRFFDHDPNEQPR